MGILAELTKQYSLSKTLRFALLPCGYTAENIKNILVEDGKRVQDYKDAKQIIDEYHKSFNKWTTYFTGFLVLLSFLSTTV